MDIDKRTKFRDEVVSKINALMPEIFEIYRNNGKDFREDIDYLYEEALKEYDKRIKEMEDGELDK